MMPVKTFDFGTNWQSFSEQRLDSTRVNFAADSLKSLLRVDDLAGATFLDLGCGSGLFSIAAYQLGASKVVGIDINPKCIEVSGKNRDRHVPNASISFIQASVLEPESVKHLGQFDIIYAWGVLHHTGKMWDAIRNSADLVSPGGVFALSIYNKHISSPVWAGIKRFYNRLPSKIIQSLMVMFFAGIIYVAKLGVTRRNPLEKERGMDFWHDVVDWIGGHPYEYARPEDIIAFLAEKGFELENFVRAQVPTGCNEYAFRRIA